MANSIIATYRLQINKDFTLYDAARVLPHLKSLGITHIYLSPVFESKKGSMHGYDICDFTKVSSERGGEEALAELDILCKKEGMHILLDIVPNHMGIAGENPFWIDVLARGKDSPFWKLFDLRVEDNDKIHLPILDKPLEESLSSGDAKIMNHRVYGRVVTIGDRILPLGEKDADEQAYKPVTWTESFEKISYRRFFDITDLIGIRVEDRQIYDMAHRCLLDLCRKYESIAGVRVDHVDGLADPATYLGLLKSDIDRIWVEKILSGDERLPDDWPVEGTTGYEFTSCLNDLLVYPEGFKVLETYWREKIEPGWKDFEDCVLQSKDDILRSLFPSELKRLVSLSAGIGPAEQAEIFWRGMTVALDVYRTYAGEKPFSARDLDRIKTAAGKARRRFGRRFADAEKFFMPVLLAPQTERHRQIVREWQQLSGPVMAKGLEDCAHYRYTPLAALNEVGCESEIRTKGMERYFAWCAMMAGECPHSLLATSTHDTKRSEDVRARLYALADNPHAWIEFFEQAVSMNAAFKTDFNLRPATEYFLYQAIVGIWPWNGDIDADFVSRVCRYMRKSVREARLETSWLTPDTQYEERLQKFIKDILAHGDFIRYADSYVQIVAPAGAINSLTALTLKILGPAVPDIYQGADGWDFSLVDPDNRRPVNFAALAKEQARPLSVLLRDWKNPAFKTWYTGRLLALRRAHWESGAMLHPISVSGADAGHVIAYEGGSLVVICLRWAGRLPLSGLHCHVEANLSLQAGDYMNLITGDRFRTNGTLTLPMPGGSPIIVLLKME